MNWKYLLICLAAVILITALSVLRAQNNPFGTSQPTDYKQTLSKLLQQEKEGIRNPGLYNQIGLNYYYLGQSGKATLYFLKALRLDSSHSEARNNLEYLLHFSTDAELYNQPSFLAGVFQKAYNFFSLNVLSMLVLIFLVITVLCVHWLLHLPLGEDKAVPVMWLIIFGLIVLVIITMFGFKYGSYRDKRQAVVVVSKMEGYSGPGQEYGRLVSVHEGLIVHINRMDKSWVLVTLPNGGACWLPSEGLDRVNP